MEGRKCLSAPGFEAMFSVWRPSYDVQQMIREGAFLKVSHLQASETRSKECGLQLTATKLTRLSEEKRDTVGLYSPRMVTPLSNVCSGDCSSEVDVVGVVTEVNSEPLLISRGTTMLDHVHLQDAEGHSVVIKVWGGLHVLGYADLVQVGTAISGSNLRVADHSANFDTQPVLIASELSVFSQLPKERHLREALEAVRRTLNL
jgi:hypothetical protein